MNLIFLILIFLHCHGLYIYYVASFDKLWIPPSDGLFDKDALYYTDDYVYRYATAIYYSLRVYTLHDVGPPGTKERAANAIGGLISAMVNANIFGTISVVISELNAKKNEL